MIQSLKMHKGRKNLAGHILGFKQSSFSCHQDNCEDPVKGAQNNFLSPFDLSPKNIRFTYLSIFALIGLVATLFGILLGWLIQLNFVFLLKDYFPTNFPPAGFQPFFFSGAIVFFCLLVFSPSESYHTRLDPRTGQDICVASLRHV